jgi:hypothetical protein
MPRVNRDPTPAEWDTVHYDLGWGTSTGVQNCLKVSRAQPRIAWRAMQSVRPSQTPSRRRHPRTPVQVQVHWHNRYEEGVSAEVFDVSAEGLFIVSAAPLPEAVDSGDLVWVIVPSTAGEEVLTGTVRWRGFHPTHNLPGLGVELDSRGQDLIQRLFPATSIHPPSL